MRLGAGRDSHMVGRTFSNFEILELIGGGGMGVVYKARDLKLGRLVALKFLPLDIGKDQTAKARFIQEAQVTSTLDHPNICTIYQVAETDDGQMFIAMGYYEGETVKAKIARGPLPLPAAIDIAKQTAEGLAKAHAAKIVHRDIKPANIMVTTEGVVKILDFGLAKLGTGTHLTRTGTTMGTLPYMSPEQTTGRPADHRTDIWSMGVLLYEMITGELPFKGDHPGAVIYAIINTQPAPLSYLRAGVPADLERIVGKALAKDPAHRYSHAAEVLAALDAIGSGRDVASVSDWETATVASVSYPWPVEPSVAVLPFVNMSGDPEQEYFSDGVTEEIIAQLSKIPGVRVIARTSVMRYKNTDKELSQIAQDLRVTHIIEGSVRRAGNRVRITSGLVDGATSRQLWMETYDRDLTDIFEIQTDVSRRISEALSTTLSPSQKLKLVREPRDIEAYQLFLKARYFLNKVSPDGIERAIRFFQQALDIDPADARSYAGISTCYATAGHFDFMPPQQAFPKAKAAAQKALELNDSLAEAQTSIGLVLMFHDWDWKAADQSFRRAVEINPNWAEAHTYYSWCLCVLRQFDRAVREASRATDLDPLSPFVNTNLGWVLTMASRSEEAIEQLKRTLDIDPHYLPALTVLGQAYLAKGDVETAVEYLKKWSWRATFVALAYAWSGRTEQARKELEEILDPAGQHQYRPSEIALIYLCLRETQEAARWLDIAYESRDYMLALQMCPDWAPGRTDPLVAGYLERMGLQP